MALSPRTPGSFGDAAHGSSTAANPNYPYGASGTYHVTLTVTDNDGATGSVTNDVTVTVPIGPNQNPTAAFTASFAGLSASFDASTSTDPDGTIKSYAWDFGDGTNGTGKIPPAHAYTASGNYTVKLTVTDDRDGTATKSIEYPVAAGTIVGADLFNRTTTNSWGTPDTGGAWTLSTASLFSTDGTSGKMVIPTAGGGPTAKLSSLSALNYTVQVDSSINKSVDGGGPQVMVFARKSGNNDYRVKLRYLASGQVNVGISRVVTTETVLSEVRVPNLTWTPNTTYRLKVSVIGDGTTTRIQAKVFPVGGTEPTAWQTSVTDTTAVLQNTPGYVMLQAYAYSTVTTLPITATIDNLIIASTA